jgi:hypothetical protein
MVEPSTTRCPLVQQKVSGLGDLIKERERGAVTLRVCEVEALLSRRAQHAAATAMTWQGNP